MQALKDLVSLIKNELYMHSLHPVNREQIEKAQELLVENSGKVSVRGTTIDTTEITAPQDALAAIFTVSANTLKTDDQSIEMMSPLGVAMHINSALEPPEALN